MQKNKLKIETHASSTTHENKKNKYPSKKNESAPRPPARPHFRVYETPTTTKIKSTCNLIIIL